MDAITKYIVSSKVKSMTGAMGFDDDEDEEEQQKKEQSRTVRLFPSGENPSLTRLPQQTKEEIERDRIAAEQAEAKRREKHEARREEMKKKHDELRDRYNLKGAPGTTKYAATPGSPTTPKEEDKNCVIF